jgi:WD40 repeat protein
VTSSADSNPLQSDFTVACPRLDIPPTPVLLPAPSLNADSSASTSANSASQEAPAPSLLRLSVRGGIECFALSGDERRVIVAGRDGQARVVEVVRFEAGANAKGKRLGKGKETALRGHLGDLTAAEFVRSVALSSLDSLRSSRFVRMQFPSNEVVLTASSDMTLRVFSATVRKPLLPFRRARLMFAPRRTARLRAC